MCCAYNAAENLLKQHHYPKQHAKHPMEKGTVSQLDNAGSETAHRPSTKKLHKIQKNFVVTSAKNALQKTRLSPHTSKVTWEKQMFAKCVQKKFPPPVTSLSTCEHTLEKKHIVARGVEKDFLSHVT